MNIKTNGIIIYWNGIYGFIEYGSNQSVFFHRSSLNYNNVQLIDSVEFVISKSAVGKHVGRLIAIDINFIVCGELKNYSLSIARVEKWNPRHGYGYLDQKTLSGIKIKIHRNRLLFSKKLKIGELVVFNAVKSKRNPSDLFAFFAYSLNYEDDIEFLISQYKNNRISEIKKFIIDSGKREKAPVDQRFYAELIVLDGENDLQYYKKTADLIRTYRTQSDFIPKLDLLEKFFSDRLLIQLWESDLIGPPGIERISKYFAKASADKKREIATRLRVKDRTEILNIYIAEMEKFGRFSYLNNDIKTLLDILFRNEKTRILETFEVIKNRLIHNLSGREIIDLWLQEYIGELPEGYLIKHFNIEDLNLLNSALRKKDSNGKYKGVIWKIFEEYFVVFAKTKHIKQELETAWLINYLQIFQSQFPEKYEQIIAIVDQSITDSQRFILWLSDIEIDFDIQLYISQNQHDLNDYDKLKIALKLRRINNEGLITFTDVEENGLVSFAEKYEWNDLVYPVKIIGKNLPHGFLTDIATFNKVFNQAIDLSKLAESIYNTVPKYNEIHLRLWLYYFADQEHFNYYGFRDSFKKLEKEEQKEFRNRVNFSEVAKVAELENALVLPCMLFTESDDVYEYTATIQNLYFHNGSIILRLHDGLYSTGFEAPLSNTGLNRIPPTHHLNEIKFQIRVESNAIVSFSGLDDFFIQIHTAEIDSVFGKVAGMRSESTNVLSYAEDWILRQQIVQYLNKNHESTMQPRYVNEPYNFMRRLDEHSGIDTYQTAGIFSFSTTDGYAIVWENIDDSRDKATYVFKCEKQDHKMQLDKLIHAISSISQLRSTLSSSREIELLPEFRNNLGFVGTVKRNRGRVDPFELWLERVEKTFSMAIQQLPAIEKQEELLDWVPGIEHMPPLKSSTVKSFGAQAEQKNGSSEEVSSILNDTNLVRKDSDPMQELERNSAQSDENLRGSEKHLKNDLLQQIYQLNNFLLHQIENVKYE